MLNRVILIGTVGRDSEAVPNQKCKILRLSIATDESFKDKNTGEWKKTTEWHNVIKFLKTEESQSISKGALVYVEGKLKTSKYLNRSGVEVSTTSIVADKILSLRKKEEQKEEQKQSSNYPPMQSSNYLPMQSSDYPMMIDDDIPF
jgi:single-strand DNA-binding protein